MKNNTVATLQLIGLILLIVGWIVLFIAYKKDKNKLYLVAAGIFLLSVILNFVGMYLKGKSTAVTNGK